MRDYLDRVTRQPESRELPALWYIHRADFVSQISYRFQLLRATGIDWINRLSDEARTSRECCYRYCAVGRREYGREPAAGAASGVCPDRDENTPRINMRGHDGSPLRADLCSDPRCRAEVAGRAMVVCAASGSRPVADGAHQARLIAWRRDGLPAGRGGSLEEQSNAEQAGSGKRVP